MKWNIIYLDETSSTNDVANNLPHYSCVVAKKQTSGRGRLGRTWISCEGNLFFSVVLKNYGELSPLLSFVLAVSVAESLNGYNIQLKWPNDILLDGKKVAGILLECVDDKIIAGVGINTNTIPQGDFLYPITSLNKIGGNEELLELILHNLLNNIKLFEKDGFLTIREKWLRFSLGIGKRIKVCLLHETIEGVFYDLTEGGAIKLKRDNQSCQTIMAGDVFLLDEGNKE